MFDITISKDYLVDTEGTSDGTQLKFFKDGYWYKENNEGQEGKVEYLVSKLLTFSDLPKIDYVIYEECRINGRDGCRSKTFLKQNESFITLERMYGNVVGEPLFEKLKQFKSIDKSVTYVLKFFKDIIDVDLTDYFKKVITLDYFTLNEDRHFHNLGIIFDEKYYRHAPIFDNGKSLLNCNLSVNRDFPIEENVKRVVARPFSGSHKAMFDYFGQGFKLNFDKAIDWLQTEEESYYKQVLLYQLNKLKNEIN